MKSLIVRSLVVVGVAACAFVAPGSAAACGGGDWEFVPAVDYRPKGLDTSEKELQDGTIVPAAARVLRMFPDLRKAKLGINPKIDRAYRILALATARADGALAVERELPAYLHGTWLGKSNDERAENLRWAAETMRSLSEKKQDDPALKSELGEVLAKVDGHQDEALALLGGLAEKDLIASPEAYAALARLRDRAGDKSGREVALTKCEAMAKTASSCGRERFAGTVSLKEQT